jgi:hypothetical protein
MYTAQQEQNAIAFSHGCEDYLLKLINYQALNFATGVDLSKNPEIMDKLLNLYRSKDMCVSFLIDHTARSAGHFLEELDATQIDRFFKNYDPIDLAEFFQQEAAINNFILENEFGKADSFKNDKEFQKCYEIFIKLAKTGKP